MKIPPTGPSKVSYHYFQGCFIVGYQGNADYKPVESLSGVFFTDEETPSPIAYPFFSRAEIKSPILNS